MITLAITGITAAGSAALIGWMLAGGNASSRDQATRRLRRESSGRFESPRAITRALNPVCLLAGGAIGLGATAGANSLPTQAVAAVLLASAALSLPPIVARWIERRRIKRLQGQLVAALNIIASGVKSSLSLDNAMRQVVGQLPNPMSAEFARVIEDIELGETTENALRQLARRVPLEDLELWVASICCTLSRNGRVNHLCESAATMVEERVRVEQKINVLLAPTRAQAFVVFLAPPFLLFALAFVQPSFVELLFESTQGLLTMAIVLAWNIAGFIVMKRTTSIGV